MKLVIANWKNNPTSSAEAIELAKASDCENLVICPPFSFLGEVGAVLKKAKLGAQDFSSVGELKGVCRRTRLQTKFFNFDCGFAKKIRQITSYMAHFFRFASSKIKKFPQESSSATDPKNNGVKYVILGHSDRRKLGETNEIIAKKIELAINADLIPILCVGETLAEREAGQKEKIISDQINSSFSQLSIVNCQLSGDVYVAYEPVWAISTNPNAEIDTPENTLQTIDFIKNELLKSNKELICPGPDREISRVEFLYGGSVNSKNIESFIKHPEISGVLVGGASLQPEEVGKMAEIAKRY